MHDTETLRRKVHAEAAEGFHRRALGLLQQAGRPEAGERRLQFLSLAVEVPPLPPERLVIGDALRTRKWGGEKHPVNDKQSPGRPRCLSLRRARQHRPSRS